MRSCYGGVRHKSWVFLHDSFSGSVVLAIVAKLDRMVNTYRMCEARILGFVRRWHSGSVWSTTLHGGPATYCVVGRPGLPGHSALPTAGLCHWLCSGRADLASR